MSDRSRTVAEAIEATVREEWGRVLATLIGYVRDLTLAEDVLQDALVAALEHWPERGVPDSPRAWLLQTARRKAIDRYRRDATLNAKREELQALIELNRADDEGDDTVIDERLSLIFTCCHPALGEQARIALTLKTLGGLTTTEIARAFLTPETTMAQRLVRAKSKIKAANIPYQVPPPHLWPERFDSVLSVIYFIFNEGYSATSGSTLTRGDLSDEAIRLGRILAALAPGEPEASGLLALMLLHDSRRDARTDDTGEFVALQHQDRSLWDRRKIDEGERILHAALTRMEPGPYQLQAAISALHANAGSHADTDWSRIAALYRRLYDFRPNAVVRVNEAVARSFAEGADAGLQALAALEQDVALERYQPFHAAKADLLRRAGRTEDAAREYRRAIELTTNATERRFLERRLEELG